MDLARLRYFCAVVDAGSFSRAAASVNLTQPSLSRQVQLLEEELGQRLVERHGRGVLPTEAGVALLNHARAIFELTEQARIDMEERQKNPKGRLIIGMPPRVSGAITADLVERFHARFPEAGITVMDGLSLRLRELLISGRCHLAIMFDPVPSPQLHLETLLREPIVLVSKQTLPPRMTFAEVIKRRLVVPSAPNALRRLIDNFTAPRGASLRLVAEVDSLHTALHLAARGVADTVVPLSAPRQTGIEKELNVCLITEPATHNKIVLAAPSARPSDRLSKGGAQFLRELIVHHFSENQ
jgi:LysR family nitrogen assimilation transcriptional regulator